MKIGKPSDIAASTAPAATQAAAGHGAARAGAPVAGRGRGEAGATSGVTVSMRARALEMVGGGDIDMNKVEAVRAAIQQGTFKINPEVIADKLLANAKEMLARA